MQFNGALVFDGYLFWDISVSNRIVLIAVVTASYMLTPCFGQAAAGIGERKADATSGNARQSTLASQEGKSPSHAKAHELFGRTVKAYLDSDLELFSNLAKDATKKRVLLSPTQRGDLIYMQKTAKSFRPKWWGNCLSPSNISFNATIWGDQFVANYQPSMALGSQRIRLRGKYVRQGNSVEYRVDGVDVIVSWQPTLVNSRNAARGKLAEIHGTTHGDMGEVIVWHELGHNYITNSLSLDHVVELYKNHPLLYNHLQEFYADMTSVYHASPHARRPALMFRLGLLDYYDELEPHTRGAHAVGAIVLAEILQDIDKWPSVHLPPEPPKQQAELNTIIYVYEHWAASWSVAQDRILRDLAMNFMRREGRNVLRSRGMVLLANKLKISLMAAQDRHRQKQRDAWVVTQLQVAKNAGRTDQLAEGEIYDPPPRRKDRDGGGRDEKKIDKEALRIEIPW